MLAEIVFKLILSLSEEDSYFPALITKSDYNFLQVLHD